LCRSHTTSVSKAVSHDPIVEKYMQLLDKEDEEHVVEDNFERF